MISKLKRKFIWTATAFMFLLMAVLVLIMNIVNYYGVISESDRVLDVLVQPDAPFLGDIQPPEGPEDMQAYVPPGMSPEVPYESRFFFASVSAEGEIRRSDLTRIVSVDDDSAKAYINRAIQSPHERGFIGQFRYVKMSGEDETRIIFLDCGRRLDSFRSFLMISVVTGLLGCLVMFIAFVLAAGKIVAPIAESYDKQKRFISDAGHELKTPLTIINANVDLLELDGEKEELTDIRQQTTRLTELTNNLIMLSKMEETKSALSKIEMPLSDIVSETAASFRAPAVSLNLSFLVQVTPDITIEGSPDAVRQMVSVLLENAMKYTPEGGEVTLELKTHRKNAVLSVSNTTQTPVDEKELPQVFDRFYRSDLSRNTQTGGHGIGLSIAKAIAVAHEGSIAASTKTGRDFCVTVSLPLGS